MPRKKKIRDNAITVLPPSSATWDMEKVVPHGTFEQLPFWHALLDADKETLKNETYQLISQRRTYGLAQIFMGQHLASIKLLLDKFKGGFTAYLKRFKFAKRTGYRYIEDYETILNLVPINVLQYMLVSGFEIDHMTRTEPLGEYTLAHKALAINGENPPTTKDPNAAMRYVSKLKAQKSALDEDPRSQAIIQQRVLDGQSRGEATMDVQRNSYEFLLRQCLHMNKNALKKLPVKQREMFLDSLIGFLLHYRGLSSKTFYAQTVPGELERKVGRPRKAETEEIESEAIDGIGAELVQSAS